MFNLNYPIEGLQGALYNPRQITADALLLLQASIRELGMAKPIIATPNGTIVAGHQRTKTLRSMGITHSPVFLVDATTPDDEIRFNQLHNGTDIDDTEFPVYVPADTTDGYSTVDPKNIRGQTIDRGANVRAEICKLIIRYGEWGAAIVTYTGEVISGQQYALSCKMLNKPLRIYRIPDKKAPVVRYYFSQQYGAYNYDHLAKTTYTQTFAQMHRLRGGDKKQNYSPTYQDLVIPSLQKTESVLDFGCGQADYVKMLKKQGYNIQGVEFFYRKADEIDTSAVHGMIDTLCDHLTNHGLFDVVVCDSVLNSTDSMQAEIDVMTCVNAFCKPGGRVYFSGRRRERIDTQMRSTIQKDSKRRYIEFLDEHGYSALYRKGNWFYQKFHSQQQVDELMKRYFSADSGTQFKTEAGFQVAITKKKTLPDDQITAALEREFNLMWPEGKSVNRHREILAAYAAATHTPQRQIDSSDT